MGNEARANEYWKKEEERLCRICQGKEETLTHVLQECEGTGNKEEIWIEQVKGDRKSIIRLNRIRWKRKRWEEQTEQNMQKHPNVKEEDVAEEP